MFQACLFKCNKSFSFSWPSSFSLTENRRVRAVVTVTQTQTQTWLGLRCPPNTQKTRMMSGRDCLAHKVTRAAMKRMMMKRRCKMMMMMMYVTLILGSDTTHKFFFLSFDWVLVKCPDEPWLCDTEPTEAAKWISVFRKCKNNFLFLWLWYITTHWKWLLKMPLWAWLWGWFLKSHHKMAAQENKQEWVPQFSGNNSGHLYFLCSFLILSEC